MKTSNHWKLVAAILDRGLSPAPRSWIAATMLVVLLSTFYFPQFSVAETLVHPQRDDLAGRTFLEVGIPRETYTNGLVFYMDATGGDYNAGATTYFIPDLSTNRNDATQTVLNSQPTLVYTNGEWRYSTDGIDDFATINYYPTSNTVFEMYGRFRAVSATAVTKGLGAHDTGAQSRFYIASNNSKWLGAYGSGFTFSTGNADTNTHHFKFNKAGLFVDGTLVCDTSANTFGSSTPNKFLIGAIGGLQNTVNRSNAEIKWAKIYEAAP